MKYRKRPPLTAREIQVLVVIGIVAGAVLGTLIGADIQLSRGLSGGGGFFSPWQGARAFLFERIPPYSGTVASTTQLQVYGQPARTGQNPYILAIPFFLLPLYFPFALSADPATARGIWMFISEAALVGAAFLSLNLVDWKPGRLFEIGFALLSVFGFYSAIALVDGGPAVVLGFLYLAVVFTYASGQDELAGALLAFTLFSWEIGVLFVPFVLWKAIYDKRGRVLAGFGMVLAILLIVSFIIYPGWITPFATASLATVRAQYGITNREVLQHLWPTYGERAAQATTILGIILLLYEWSATRHGDLRRFVWAAALTLAVTPLLGMRTDISNLVVLFPALAMIFAAISNRWRSGSWLASLLLLIVFLLPWGWFMRWYLLRDARSYDLLLLFFPVFTIVGLYWTRWWFLRPPRTWLDHVHSTVSPATRPVAGARRLPSSTD